MIFIKDSPENHQKTVSNNSDEIIPLNAISKTNFKKAAFKNVSKINLTENKVSSVSLVSK